MQSDVKRDATANKVTFNGIKLTNAVKDWYKSGNNNGFVIRYTDESKTNPDYNLFYSSDNTTSTSYMPTLTVSYFNTLKIYQTKKTYIKDESGNIPEDMKCNTKTEAELKNMEWISFMDFPSSVDTRRKHWESLCKIGSDGKLTAVALEMVDKFMSGTGGEYSNKDLTDAAQMHEKTREYVNDVITQIKALLKEKNGDITKLKYDVSDRDNSPLVEAMKNAKIYEPVFNTSSDQKNGLTICVNGTWGNEIIVKKYSFDGTSYECELQFTLYDHFGLDEEDINKYGIESGFRDWYILQHSKEYNGAYKPFVTKMTFTESFKGGI